MHDFPRLLPTAHACHPPPYAMQGHLFSFVDLQVQTRGNEVVHTSLDMLGTWEHAGAVTDIAVGGGGRGARGTHLPGHGDGRLVVLRSWGLYPHTHTTRLLLPPYAPHPPPSVMRDICRRLLTWRPPARCCSPSPPPTAPSASPVFFCRDCPGPPRRTYR